MWFGRGSQRVVQLVQRVALSILVRKCLLYILVRQLQANAGKRLQASRVRGAYFRLNGIRGFQCISAFAASQIALRWLGPLGARAAPRPSSQGGGRAQSVAAVGPRLAQRNVRLQARPRCSDTQSSRRARPHASPTCRREPSWLVAVRRIPVTGRS